MREPVRRIVAGLSELTPGDPTLLVATEVARASGAELHLVHAWHAHPRSPDARRGRKRQLSRRTEMIPNGRTGG